jgi:hypothetical protein
VYLDWPVVGWGFVLFWVSFIWYPLVPKILSWSGKSPVNEGVHVAR